MTATWSEQEAEIRARLGAAMAVWSRMNDTVSDGTLGEVWTALAVVQASAADVPLLLARVAELQAERDEARTEQHDQSVEEGWAGGWDDAADRLHGLVGEAEAEDWPAAVVEGVEIAAKHLEESTHDAFAFRAFIRGVAESAEARGRQSATAEVDTLRARYEPLEKAARAWQFGMASALFHGSCSGNDLALSEAVDALDAKEDK